MKLYLYKAKISFCVPKGFSLVKLSNGYYMIQDIEKRTLMPYSLGLLFIDSSQIIESGDNKMFVIRDKQNTLQKCISENINPGKELIESEIEFAFYPSLKDGISFSTIRSHGGDFCVACGLVSLAGSDVIYLNAHVKIEVQSKSDFSSAPKEESFEDTDINIVYLPLVPAKPEEKKEVEPFDDSFLIVGNKYDVKKDEDRYICIYKEHLREEKLYLFVLEDDNEREILVPENEMIFRVEPFNSIHDDPFDDGMYVVDEKYFVKMDIGTEDEDEYLCFYRGKEGNKYNFELVNPEASNIEEMTIQIEQSELYSRVRPVGEDTVISDYENNLYLDKDFIKSIEDSDKSEFKLDVDDHLGTYEIIPKKKSKKVIQIFATPFWEEAKGISAVTVEQIKNGEKTLDSEIIRFDTSGDVKEDAKTYVDLINAYLIKIDTLIFSEDNLLQKFEEELESKGFEVYQKGASSREYEFGIDEDSIRVSVDEHTNSIHAYTDNSSDEIESDFEDYQDVLNWIDERINPANEE